MPGLFEPSASGDLEADNAGLPVIASQLTVTLVTVKKHASHVLGNLGAANRTEALARAREPSVIG